MKKLAVLFLIWFSLLCCKRDTVQELIEPRVDIVKIDAMVDHLIFDKDIPGASVGISIKDSIVYRKGFGFTDTTKVEQIHPKSIFPIASITKLITAIGILKLQEEGRLSIEHPITQYFPELPKSYSKIKIKNLLNHTSGLTLMTELADSLRQYKGIDIRNEKIFDYLTPQRMNSPPNEVWAYNNTPGYLLLSLLIERVVQMDYGGFLHNYFSVPLGLKNFGLCSSGQFSNGYSLTFLMDNPMARYLDGSKIFEQLKGQGGICASAERFVGHYDSFAKWRAHI
ncbi:serine hydrolase [Muricauda sp. MAR_2010_75]|uniref:serine hydrolase domain-containing protein n=1 Tax=Allomuricauda sp. MAR_2010_75 TaxID=1250232 RepID=UPI0005628A30|nr:serine hydrolase domain-containing protein [Muricauda sp. MAR_2010_75]